MSSPTGKETLPWLRRRRRRPPSLISSLALPLLSGFKGLKCFSCLLCIKCPPTRLLNFAVFREKWLSGAEAADAVKPLRRRLESSQEGVCF